MKANFKIENFRDILFEGKYFDLHNNFKFESFHYDLESAQVTLEWVKDIGNWIPDSEFETVTITHTGVLYFKVLPTSENASLYDRQTLSEVTFFPSSERDEMEQFLNQMEPDEDDDIIYTFIGEQILRIGCENVILTFK
jgi:hypothetical protein